MRKDYPANVCVHGNGFIQIALGGLPETRIHIWTPGVKTLTQKVNTQRHNHRFGFVSAVLRGALKQDTFEPEPFASETRFGRWWEVWKASSEKGATGNRSLVKQQGRYRINDTCSTIISEGHAYSVLPYDFHKVMPLTAYAVTLMTKTTEHAAPASVLCRNDNEPDQAYSRFQIPWGLLLNEHIIPALEGTPFDLRNDVEIFR